ncbi:MAG: uridine kinase family protein [Angustibacter sp.]
MPEPDPVQQVVALLRQRDPRAGGTHLVAVDGPSGAGKTTFAARLSDALGGAPVVHMDDLYPGWDGLADAVPRAVEWVAGPLLRGESARYRRFDWVRQEYAEWHDVPPAPVTVLEGVGSAARALAPALTATVWVDAAEPVRMARGIARDGEAYCPHWERWAVQEREHFAVDATRERADVVVTTG